jgi:hypothetical protein
MFKILYRLLLLELHKLVIDVHISKWKDGSAVAMYYQEKTTVKTFDKGLPVPTLQRIC